MTYDTRGRPTGEPPENNQSDGSSGAEQVNEL
jgi:hypothetical protein